MPDWGFNCFYTYFNNQDLPLNLNVRLGTKRQDDYYRDRSESGVDLSSDEDDDRAREERRNQDYVEIKIKGLQDEIKKLKAMQVIEQTNINEIQSKINQISMEKSLRETNKIKQELTRQEKYMVPNKA